jgi:hypothetical protein
VGPNTFDRTSRSVTYKPIGSNQIEKYWSGEKTPPDQTSFASNQFSFFISDPFSISPISGPLIVSGSSKAPHNASIRSYYTITRPSKATNSLPSSAAAKHNQHSINHRPSSLAASHSGPIAHLAPSASTKTRWRRTTTSTGWRPRRPTISHCNPKPEEHVGQKRRLVLCSMG